MWKKSVLDWRKRNPTENMTLDKMGPLLKTAVDSFSPDGKAIQNGFKACGLYPWNPDAVNYSKCLGTSMMYRYVIEMYQLMSIRLLQILKLSVIRMKH